MFFRLLYQSFHRQRRSKLLAGNAIVCGVAVATAMLAVATDIGDKMNRELRAFGANIIVYPAADTVRVRIGGAELKPASAAAFLKESDLPRIKGIFWRHNILGFSPFLEAPAQATSKSGEQATELVGTYFAKSLKFGDEAFTTGVRSTHPWWRVEGSWPEDDSNDEALVGVALAKELEVQSGQAISVAGHQLRVKGVLTTGSAEDHQIVAPLHLVQQIAGFPNAVHTVYVSALTKPEDAFARRDPGSLSPADRDRWYCSPYANSIAFQLMEALPGSRAEQIRRVAQSEGKVLNDISGILLLVSVAALIAAALAVSAAMATALMERRREIGLMKAIGASRATVAALFAAEAGILTLLGTAIGFGVGAALARAIGNSVFGSAMSVHLALFPLVLLIAFAIVAAGSAMAIRRAASFSPALALRSEI
jgi:putative ABC transport system permease protein